MRYYEIVIIVWSADTIMPAPTRHIYALWSAMRDTWSTKYYVLPIASTIYASPFKQSTMPFIDLPVITSISGDHQLRDPLGKMIPVKKIPSKKSNNLYCWPSKNQNSGNWITLQLQQSLSIFFHLLSLRLDKTLGFIDKQLPNT